MRFLDSIMRWFYGEPGEAAWDDCGDAATAVLDEPAPEEFPDEGSGPASPEPIRGWWNAPIERGASRASSEPIDRALYDRLVHVVDDPELELPRVPQIVHRAMVMLDDENVDYQKLARLTEQDPALAAEILRVANSLTFRGISNVSRLDIAFTRLGCRTLRSVVVGASMRDFAIRTGGDERSVGEELWRRALAGSATAALIARRVGLPEDELSLAGLLHDVGALGMLRVLYDYQRTHDARIGRALFDRLVREWHEHLGLRLAESWNLPAPLPDLIGAHHSMPSADDPYRSERLIVMASDAICAKLGYGGTATDDLFDLEAFIALGIDPTADTCAWLEGLPAVIRQRIPRAA